MTARADLNAADLKQATPGNKSTKTKQDGMPHVVPGKPIGASALMSQLQAAGIGLNKARGFIAELVEDGLLFRWHQKRKNGPAEVLYAREPQPEPELPTAENTD